MNRTRDYLSKSVEETEQIGESLGRRMRGGEVLLLFGPLGAGKTQFVRGFASGLGIDPKAISSPSYALINEHPGRITLYHADLFRVAVADLTDLGLEDLYASDVVVAVEWGERLEEAGWDLGRSIMVEVDYHPDDEEARILTIDEAWRT